MVKVTVEGACAALSPPRFLSSAETEHGDAQPEVSTDTTVYRGGSVERLEKSITSVGAAIPKSLSKSLKRRSASVIPSTVTPFLMRTLSTRLGELAATKTSALGPESSTASRPSTG